MSREKITEMYIKAMEDAEAHPEDYSDVFEGYENNPAKALALVDWQKDRIKSLEMTVKILGEMVSKKQSENVIVLPCKVGTTLYFLYNSPYADKPDLTPRIYKTADWYFEIDKTGIVINTKWIHSFNKKYDYYLGETVFLTKQEAEEALAKMKGA